MLTRAVVERQRAGQRGRSEHATLCLVHSPCPALDDDRLEPPLGLLYIASAARSSGRSVTLVDLASVPLAGLESRVPDGHDVYGFSTYSVTYAITAALAQAVRARNPAALIVAGGPHASALPHAVAADGFDVVVTGEGELAMPAILEAVTTGEPLPRILVGTPPDPLDDLPFPDYNLVDLTSYHRQVAGQRSVSVLSSRGCPYRCTFCNSNIMGAGRRIRFRSPENVVAEIREIKDRYGVRHFRFQDDIFTVNQKRLVTLCGQLAREDIVYRCFARLSNFTPEVARMLAGSGCRHVSFGVESGSLKLLARHAMHKDQTPEDIRSALASAEGAGLRTRIYLMVGFPGETDDTIAETLDLVKDCPWHEFAVYPLIAYPGTPLHDHPERYGITHINRDYSAYLQVGGGRRAGFTVRTAEFDEDQVRDWRERVIRELAADGRVWAGDSPGFQ